MDFLSGSPPEHIFWYAHSEIRLIEGVLIYGNAERDLISFLLPDIIHTVGPVGRQEKLLESCYKTSLELAYKFKIRSVVCSS